MGLLNLLATYHLISHHVFPSLEQHSESSNHEGRDTDEDHIKQEEDRVLDDSKDGFVLLSVQHCVCPSLDEEVKEVGHVEAESRVVEEVTHVVLGNQQR